MEETQEKKSIGKKQNKNQETITNVVNEKHNMKETESKIKELEKMLPTLEYYISVQEDEEKLKEYEEYKIMLLDKIVELQNIFNSDKESFNTNKAYLITYLSKLAYVIQTKDNEIEMNKQLKKDADKRIKSLEKSKSFLMDTILSTGKIIGLFYDYETVKLGSFSARVNSTASLNITDKNRIPEMYKKVKISMEIDIDKKMIKEALENGEDVAGAELTHNFLIKGGKLKSSDNKNGDLE